MMGCSGGLTCKANLFGNYFVANENLHLNVFRFVFCYGSLTSGQLFPDSLKVKLFTCICLSPFTISREY